MSEQGLFTVAEDDQEKELFVVAEDEYNLPYERPAPMPTRPPVEQLPITPQPIQPQPVNPNDMRPDNSEKQKPEQKSDDWRNTKDVKQFMDFLAREMKRIGNPMQWRTQVEKERGLGQLKRLNQFVSEALRNDYDSNLNVSQIDQARNMIERYIDEVETALEGLRSMKKQRKQMRRRGDEEHDMTKEAGIPGVQMYITPFERAIVGALINGKVSGGRNLEELYAEAKKKYGLNPREELSVLQILSDMGYPLLVDRLRLGDNNDPTREDGFGEWQTQYYA